MLGTGTGQSTTGGPADENPAFPPGSGTVASVVRLKQLGLLTPYPLRQALSTTKDSLTAVTLLKAAPELRLPDAFDLAQPFTRSRDRRVRLAATGVLGPLDKPRALPALRELVKDRDAEVSLRAVHSL